tara:strand:- start:88 stop:363 length:276 start_codon:yes stop_codon:yes gene_type:complete
MSVSCLTPGMSFNCDSWGCTIQGQSFVKKQTPATNWTMYMVHFTKYARGFDFETYKEGYGIKKIKVAPFKEEHTRWDENYEWGGYGLAKKR